ncbi:MAG: hypothetical protein Q8R01_13515 [Ramlibacter sp.]|nr:hypothetical protein [Ramlibacter sp.]
MPSNTTKTAALIEVNNVLQLRVTTMTKGGRSIDVGLKLSRLNAEKLARTLLRFALPGEQWVRLDADTSKKATFVATYDEAFKPSCIVRLRDPV